MYILTKGAGMNFAFPDVNNTPVGVGVSPITYPNTSYSTTSSPTVDHVTIECTPVVNLASRDSMSIGDEAGSLGGVTSFTVSGETMYTTGSTKVVISCFPPAHLTSSTGQNCLGVLPNTSGSCLVPSQVIVMAV